MTRRSPRLSARDSFWRDHLSVKKEKDKCLLQASPSFPQSRKSSCSCFEMASIVTLPFELTAPPAEWSKPEAQGKISGKCAFTRPVVLAADLVVQLL